MENQCLKQIKDSNNVILSSPTGSGKTSIFLKWALEKEQRPIYITSPIKALSNQIWRVLQEQGFIVGLEKKKKLRQKDNFEHEENLKKEKYNPDSLFEKSNEQKNSELQDINVLVEIKKETIFKIFVKFLKKLFKMN